MTRKFLTVAVTLLALAAPAFARTDAMALIPNDAVTVGVVRLADLRTSPLSSMLFQQTDKVSSNGDAEKFLTEAGLQPTKDVDVLVIATSPVTTMGTEADFLLAADGRFNVERLTAALVTRGAVKKNGYLTFADKDHSGKVGAIAFPDSHLVLAGTEQAVTEALASYAAGGTTFLTSSGLGRDASRIDSHASAWAVVDVARASRLTGSPQVPSHTANAAALQSAVKNLSTVALWATDTGDSLKLGGFGIAHDGETLQLLEDTLRGALAAMRLAVQDRAPEMVSVLRKFEVTHTTDTVQIHGTISGDALRSIIAKHRDQVQAK